MSASFLAVVSHLESTVYVLASWTVAQSGLGGVQIRNKIQRSAKDARQRIRERFPPFVQTKQA